MVVNLTVQLIFIAVIWVMLGKFYCQIEYANGRQQDLECIKPKEAKSEKHPKQVGYIVTRCFDIIPCRVETIIPTLPPVYYWCARVDVFTQFSLLVISS